MAFEFYGDAYRRTYLYIKRRLESAKKDISNATNDRDWAQYEAAMYDLECIAASCFLSANPQDNEEYEPDPKQKECACRTIISRAITEIEERISDIRDTQYNDPISDEFAVFALEKARIAADAARCIVIGNRPLITEECKPEYLLYAAKQPKGKVTFTDGVLSLEYPFTVKRELEKSWYIAQSVARDIEQYERKTGKTVYIPQPVVVVCERIVPYITNAVRDNDNTEDHRVVNAIFDHFGYSDAPNKMSYFSCLKVDANAPFHEKIEIMSRDAFFERYAKSADQQSNPMPSETTQNEDPDWFEEPDETWF